MNIKEFASKVIELSPQIIRGFKQYENNVIYLNPGELNTPMPWSLFAGMNEQDLSAIYNYLKSIPPVHHKIENINKSNK